MGAGQGPRLLRGILFADAGQRPALPEGALFAGAGQRRALPEGVLFAGAGQRRALPLPRVSQRWRFCWVKPVSSTTTLLSSHYFILIEPVT